MLLCITNYQNVLAFSAIFIRVSYKITYLFTYSMEQSPSQLISFQLVKKFPTFYGTQRFITEFTGAFHLSLSSPYPHLPLPEDPS